MSQTSPQSSEPRSVARYACVAAAVTVILLWTLYLIRAPLLLIYVSALFATGLAPLVRIIERQRFVVISKKRLPRGAAILVIYATVIGSLAGIAAAVVPPMVQQSQEFWKQLPDYMDSAQRKLASWGLIAPDASFKELLQQAPAGSGDAVNVVIATLWGFVGGIFGIISILLLTFYLLVDAQDIFALFVQLFPKGDRNRVSKIAELVAAKISAWLGGQMLLGLIIGSMTAIGLFVMGVPYFFVLAVIAGIGEMIPMVGPLLSAIPAVLVALTVSPTLALGVAGFCWALQLIENNVLVPKVMGETVGLRAATVIISLAIGSELLGFVGALLAVPTAAIIQVLFEELYLAEKIGVSSRLALLSYTLLSLVLTWPLVLGLGSDVPGDLGDSLLNMWILGWGADHAPRLLTGTIGWSEFWNANIFHPDPLALALSEHLFGQVLQILPVYWLTGNIILCYNLLFISTFALSAFGTYLLVRDLTGDKRAAFIAGLVYGFLPYRIASVPHVQVMSSQWMPFALYGINRFVTTGSIRALVGGTAALVMQNWSCGYYLLYFAPFVPLFVVHRMWSLGTLGTLRTWAGLVAAAAGTLILTLPFLFPYQQVQQVFGLERPFGEVVLFSANVWSYITASENLRLWGKVLRFYPHGEGETFLGFVPWLLAIVAVGGLAWTVPVDAGVDRPSKGRRIAIGILVFAVVTQLIAVLSAVIFGGFDFNFFGLMISARTPQRLLMQFVIALALLLVMSPRARIEALRMMRSPIAFAFAATILAMWLSLGPLPNAGEARVSGFGLYGVLYQYVPGFNGVRVPARYAMIAGLFLAVLAGYGFQRLLKIKTLNSYFLIPISCFLILIEGAAIPMEINRTWNQNEAVPPARVMTYANAPPVYADVALLPAGAAITEFPFGDAAWEIRYVYYAAAHWKPITNGYSGSFPPHYKERVARLQRIKEDPEAAWQSLKDSGSTHVVLHRNAFANVADADTVENWLKAHGAAEIERFPDGDILFII